MEYNKLYLGHAIDVLKTFPDECVDCFITSPPYWNLRAYQTSPIIWGGDENCDHEWGTKIITGQHTPQTKWKAAKAAFSPNQSSFCKKCSAWLGELGAEPDPDLFISHLCEVFDQVKRVLKPTGTAWINIADSYGGSGGAGGDYNEGGLREGQPKFKGNNYQPKSLVGIPERMVLEMQKRGWIRRNTCIWHKCLGEKTFLFVKYNNKYRFISIKDLYKEFKKSDDVFVLTQNAEMEYVWQRIKNIYDNGMADAVHIKTKTGAEVVSSLNHRFVTKKSTNTNKNIKYRKISLTQAHDLTKSHYLQVSQFIDNIDLPVGGRHDFDLGFVVGFYMAEGNKIFRYYEEYKDNLLSLSAQKRWSRTERGKKEVGVQLSCGVTDLDRGYLNKVFDIFKCKHYIYGNSVAVRSYDKKFVRLLDKYTFGDVCDNKYLKDNAFNKSISFLRGVVDGFLSGDGWKDVANDRWRSGIKPNEKFVEQLRLICRIIGYEFRLCSNGKNSDGYNVMNFTIRKQPLRQSSAGLIDDKIDSIQEVGKLKVYDVELEPLYCGFKGNNQHTKKLWPTSDKRRSKFNNLYFLANGIWTHNSNAMPSSAEDRFTVDFEYLYFFTKSTKYYFEKQLEPYDGPINRWGGVGIDGNGESLWDEGTGQTTYTRERNLRPNPEGRNKRTVWSINTEGYKGAHFAVFPRKLVETPIKAGCPEGGVVLDCFAGSGTTCRVAYDLKRKYVGVELNPEFMALAEKRLAQQNLFDFM